MEFRKSLKEYILDDNNKPDVHFIFKDKYSYPIVDDKGFMGALKLIRRLCFKYDYFKNVLLNEYEKNDTFIEDVLNNLQEKITYNGDSSLSGADIRKCISQDGKCGNDLESIFQYAYNHLLSYKFKQWELDNTIKTFQRSLFYKIYRPNYQFVEVVYAKSEESFKEYFKRYTNFQYQKLSVKQLRNVHNDLDHIGIDYDHPTVFDVLKNKNLANFKDIELIYHSD